MTRQTRRTPIKSPKIDYYATSAGEKEMLADGWLQMTEANLNANYPDLKRPELPKLFQRDCGVPRKYWIKPHPDHPTGKHAKMLLNMHDDIRWNHLCFLNCNEADMIYLEACATNDLALIEKYAYARRVDSIEEEFKGVPRVKAPEGVIIEREDAFDQSEMIEGVYS